MPFVVLYEWEVPPDKEEEFKKAWHQVTLMIRERYNSLGSRLHTGEEKGRFLGYAVWPDRSGWERMMEDRKDAPSPNSTLVSQKCFEVIDDQLV